MEIVMGTMTFGPRCSQEESAAILRLCKEEGVTELDTAIMYVTQKESQNRNGNFQTSLFCLLFHCSKESERVRVSVCVSVCVCVCASKQSHTATATIIATHTHTPEEHGNLIACHAL